MLGFFKRKLLESGDEAALRDIQKYISFLEVGTASEVSGILLSVAIAVKLLRTTSRTSQPFPEKYFAGIKIAETPLEQGHLSLYASELKMLHQAAAAEKHSVITQLSVAGFVVMVHSVRALARPHALLPGGRRMWRELARGVPCFVDSYREFIKADATKHEIAEAIFLPRFFVPE